MPRLHLAMQAMLVLTALLLAACGQAAPRTPAPDMPAPPTTTAAGPAGDLTPAGQSPTPTSPVSLTPDLPTPVLPTTAPADPAQAGPPAPPLFGPVEGTVRIEGGRCCAGGTTGQPVTLSVDFAARSSAGDVTEMRVVHGAMGCQTAEQLQAIPWEPLEATRTYTTTAVSGWVGWYASAQFRDGKGNLSPIVCDDISIEGMPAATP